MTIPPPPPVRAAAVLVALQAVGLLVLAGLTLMSGLRNDARVGQLLAQFAYFVVLALLVGAVSAALLRGRRWGRTPAIVVQIVLLGIGFYLAVPSGRARWGIALMVLAVAIGALLVSRQASVWISRFPPPFGAAPPQ